MKVEILYEVALITGSSQGIGFAMAHRLRSAGAEMIINGRTRKKVDAAGARLSAAILSVSPNTFYSNAPLQP
ncbi:SDR family NAD(P)-dependent oxidoreductase [Mesorhizobium sp. M0830]|uniref:SDR family NAD(P)-dependent oxidoreductase n=1 Tax=Mesorhizobium sp. M0830 TaxID=2957008 RepID=UPI003339A6D1